MTQTTLPKCNLTSTDGNVFAIIAKVTKSLRDAGLKDKSAEFANRAMECGSYDEVLQLCFEFVDVE